MTTSSNELASLARDLQEVIVQFDVHGQKGNQGATRSDPAEGVMDVDGSGQETSRRSRNLLDLAERIRRRQESTSDQSEGQGYIVFSFGGDRFVISVDWVSKIERFPRLTPVPNVRKFVRGVANLRGQILPVLDLGLLLGMRPMVTEPQGLLVLTDGQRRFGAISNDLPDYMRIARRQIRESPRIGDAISSMLIGVVPTHDRANPSPQPEARTRMSGLIDGEKLFAFVARESNAE